MSFLEPDKDIFKKKNDKLNQERKARKKITIITNPIRFSNDLIKIPYIYDSLDADVYLITGTKCYQTFYDFTSIPNEYIYKENQFFAKWISANEDV